MNQLGVTRGQMGLRASFQLHNQLFNNRVHRVGGASSIQFQLRLFANMSFVVWQTGAFES